MTMTIRTDQPVRVRSTRDAQAVLKAAWDLETSGSARDRAWAHRCFAAAAKWLDHAVSLRRRTKRSARLLDAARRGMDRTSGAHRRLVEDLLDAEEPDLEDFELALLDTVVDIAAAADRFAGNGGQDDLAEVQARTRQLHVLTDALGTARHRADAVSYEPWPLAA